jgi:hypothetical protein
MLGKRLLGMVGSLAAISVVMPVFAYTMSAPNGWYLEGNAGTSHLSNVSYPGSSSTTGWSYNANGGYKFMPYLGVEVGYSRFADTKIKTMSTTVASVMHNSYGAALRGILPISDSGFEAFAKVGVQRSYARTTIKDTTLANSIGVTASSHSKVNAWVGAGIQYYVMPELAIVGQWQRAQGNSSTGNEDLYTLGLSFIFV